MNDDAIAQVCHATIGRATRRQTSGQVSMNPKDVLLDCGSRIPDSLC